MCRSRRRRTRSLGMGLLADLPMESFRPESLFHFCSFFAFHSLLFILELLLRSFPLVLVLLVLLSCFHSSSFIPFLFLSFSFIFFFFLSFFLLTLSILHCSWLQVFPEQHELQVEPALPINDIAWSRDDSFLVFCTEAGDIWVPFFFFFHSVFFFRSSQCCCRNGIFATLSCWVTTLSLWPHCASRLTIDMSSLAPTMARFRFSSVQLFRSFLSSRWD